MVLNKARKECGFLPRSTPESANSDLQAEILDRQTGPINQIPEPNTFSDDINSMSDASKKKPWSLEFFTRNKNTSRKLASASSHEGAEAKLEVDKKIQLEKQNLPQLEANESTRLEAESDLYSVSTGNKDGKLFAHQAFSDLQLLESFANQDLFAATAEMALLKSETRTSDVDFGGKELETEKKAQLEAEENARLQAKKKALLVAEKNARLEAEEMARLKMENKVRLEKEEKARLESERKARLKAEEETRLKEEEEAQLETGRKARLEAERKARLEAEKNAQLEVERKAQLPPAVKALTEELAQAVRSQDIDAVKRIGVEAEIFSDTGGKLLANQALLHHRLLESFTKRDWYAVARYCREALTLGCTYMDYAFFESQALECIQRGQRQTRSAADEKANLKAEGMGQLGTDTKAFNKEAASSEADKKFARLEAEKKARLRVEEEAEERARLEARNKAQLEAEQKKNISQAIEQLVRGLKEGKVDVLGRKEVNTIALESAIAYSEQVLRDSPESDGLRNQLNIAKATCQMRCGVRFRASKLHCLPPCWSSIAALMCLLMPMR